MNELNKHLRLIDDHMVDYEALLPLYYQFEYHGIPFDCQVIHLETEGAYNINLTANIGYLPYSSENKIRRQQILKDFGHLMAHKLIIIDHHCNLTFPLNTMVTGELNAKKVVETILYTLLDVKDILEIISNTMQVKNIDEDNSFNEAIA